jgi:hypothetical protein
MFGILFFQFTTKNCIAVNRTWTAANNTTVFNSGGNWNPSGQPTSSDNLTIGTVGNGIYPNVSSNSYCNNITLNGDAVLDFSGAGNLHIHGNLTNNTLSADATDGLSGIISFEGTSADNTITNNCNFYKLVVDKDTTYKLVLAANTKLNIRYYLRLKNGNIDARLGTANIVLESSFPSGNWQTAYIDGTGAGEVEGQIMIQQYVAETFKTYHFLCNPVLDSNATVASTTMLEASTDQTDVYNSSYSYTPTTLPIPDFIYYREGDEDPDTSGAAADKMYGWRGANPLNGTTIRVAQAQGFCARFKPYGDTIVNKPIIWTGIVNNGSFYTPTIEYTDYDEDFDGANLIGNPYPSPIDWQNVYDDIREFPVIYVWQNNNTEYQGSFMIFDAEDNSNTTLPNDGNIAIGQGFTILANEFSMSSLEWKNSYRTGGVDYAFYRKPPVQNAIDIKLGGKNNKDLTLIHFGDFNNTDQLPYKNVPKMMNYENSIYTLTDKQNNNALNLPFPDQETTIPIGINIAESGTYYFEAANINLSIENFNAFLEDKLLKKAIPVNANFKYEFAANKGKTEDRFVIRVINKEAISESVNISVSSYAYLNNEALVFQIAAQDSKIVNASIMDATGKNVWNGQINVQNGRGQIEKSQLPQGLLFLKLNDEHSETNFKLANTN